MSCWPCVSDKFLQEHPLLLVQFGQLVRMFQMTKVAGIAWAHCSPPTRLSRGVDENVRYAKCGAAMHCTEPRQYPSPMCQCTGYYTWNLDMANAWSPCNWSIIVWENSGGLCSMLLQRQSCSLPFQRMHPHTMLPTSPNGCNRVTILAMTGLEIPEAFVRQQPLHAWTKLWK